MTPAEKIAEIEREIDLKIKYRDKLVTRYSMIRDSINWANREINELQDEKRGITG